MPYSKVVIKHEKPKVEFKDLGDKDAGWAFRNENRIEIDINLNDSEVFKTLFHECLHLMLPDLSEKSIMRLEDTIGDVLWKEGVLKLKKKWLSELLKKKKKN